MIAPNYFWLIVVILSLGTLAIRMSLIGVSHKITISARHRELFTFIPAAMFPALVVPLVFFHEGVVSWLEGKERFAILVAATLLSLRLRNMIVTLAFGLIALYVLTQL